MLTSPEFKIFAEGVGSDLVSAVELKVRLALQGWSESASCALRVNHLNAQQDIWSLDFSAKLPSCHIGIQRTGQGLLLMVDELLKELHNCMDKYEIQQNVQLFRLDRTTECDFYSQVSEMSAYGSSTDKLAMILEDDPAATAVLEASLHSLGWKVDSFSMPDEALRKIATHDYSLLLLDWNLPYKRGDDFLVAADRILTQKRQRTGEKNIIPLVICSSLDSEEIEVPEVENFQRLDVWHKSIPFSSLLNQLDKKTSIRYSKEG